MDRLRKQLTKKYLVEAHYLIDKKAWVSLEQWQDTHLSHMTEDMKRGLLRIARMGGAARYVGLVEMNYIAPWMRFAMRLTNILLGLILVGFAVGGVAALIKNCSGS